MAEVISRDGSWTFDQEVLRIVPSSDRRVHKLRRELGEITVPLTAIAGIAFEPGRKGGLRLRLREGADPLLQAAGGGLPDAANPYRLTADADRTGVAEYMVDEVRNTLLLDAVPSGPTDSYLLPGPPLPQTATAGDGTVTFDGSRIRLEWNGWAESSKSKAGPQEFTVDDVTGVEWAPTVGWENGYLRFRRPGSQAIEVAHDPNCITWGLQHMGGTSLLLAAAVVARLPHPSGGRSEASTKAVADGLGAADPAALAASDTSEQAAGPDQLLRHLRELGELHRSGVLSEEEFTVAKQALLRRFSQDDG